MRQRDYIRGLNEERMRMIHHLIGELMPTLPLRPRLVANLRIAAIECTRALSGSNSTREILARMERERMVKDVGEKERDRNTKTIQAIVAGKATVKFHCWKCDKVIKEDTTLCPQCGADQCYP